MAPSRSVTLTHANLAILTVAGRPLYLVRTPEAAAWDYQRPIFCRELPGLRFKRYLLMYENRGHREALELEVTHGAAPTRADLLGKELYQ